MMLKRVRPVRGRFTRSARFPVALGGIFALVISAFLPGAAQATKYVGAFMENGGGARALGMGHRLGTVEPGKYADLLIVRGNPLDEIRHTRRAIHVVKAGKVYDPVALFDSVRGKMGPADAEAAEWWKGNLRLGG